jgi:hypothetical protein
MKLIPLNQGYFAMVDDDDFDRVNQFRWHIRQNKKKTSTYAERFKRVLISGKKVQKGIFMHHFITGLGKHRVDHEDGNGLNNQKSNLRKCTFLQNTRNKSMQSRNTSGFKGVVRKRYGFTAQISVGGKTRCLGSSKDPKIAAALYDVAAINNFGEFARTNQKLGLLCH